MNKFFKKTILLVPIPILIFIVFTNIASAQNELLFGQNHFYTVIFRGNGEAVTYAKIAITNPDEKQLTEFSFEMPRVIPYEIAMYQMKLPQKCIRYNYNDPAKPCLEYRDPDYIRGHYYYDYSNKQAEYQKIQYARSGNLYRLTLPTPVEPYKSTAIIIAYAAKGYVKKSLGLYKFNFETLKVPSRIQKIRVVVDVDSDLLLKGKRSSVNYNMTGFNVVSLDAPQSISNKNLDRVVENIGSYGPLIKEAKNLAPNESFTVKGEYAANWFKLYLRSIFLTILIIISIFVGVYFLAKYLKQRNSQNNQTGNESNQQTTVQTPQNSINIFNLLNMSAGFLSVILTIGLTYLLKSLLESDLFRFIIIDLVIEVVSFIIIILLYASIIFGPAIIVAVKHGWKSLVSVLITEFLWSGILFIIYIALFQFELTSDIIQGGIVLD